MMRSASWFRLGLAFLVLFVVSPLMAGETSFRIPRPVRGRYVVDMPNVIDPLNQVKLDQQLARFERDTGISFYVVTIPSMGEVGGKDMKLEDFSKALFNDWNIGKRDRLPDRGVLFLIPMKDSVIRMEFGEKWKDTLDKPAEQILEADVIPSFQKQQFSAGIVKGVKSLERVIRSRVPAIQQPLNVSPPAAGESVADTAVMFQPVDKLNLNQQCAQLKKDTGVNLCVVTISSSDEVEGKGLSAQAIAERLFTQWGLGQTSPGQSDKKNDVLLLVCKSDSSLGLQMGPDWPESDRREARQAAEEKLLPAVREGGKLPESLESWVNVIKSLAAKSSAPAGAPTTSPGGK